MLSHPTFRALVRPAIVTLLAVLVAWGVMTTAAGQRLELDTVDMRIASNHGERMSPSRDMVAVVEIDQETDKRLRQGWPYSRAEIARALRNMQQAGARAVVLDIEYVGRRDLAGDSELIRTVREVEAAGMPVVFASGTTEELGNEVPVPWEGFELAAFPPGAELEPRYWGISDVSSDIDAVARSMAVERAGVESLSTVGLRAAGLAVNPDTPIAGREIQLDFDTPRDQVSSTNFADVWNGEADSVVSGRIAFVGATSAVLQDIAATPVDSRLPGVYLHVQSALNQLDGRGLTSARDEVGILVPALLVAAFGLLVIPMRRHLVWWALLSLGAVAAWGIVAWLAYAERSLLLPMAAPMIGAGTGLVTLLWLEARRAIRARQHVQAVFSRYVSPGVVKEMVGNDLLDVQPGGVSTEVTVLMSDVRGFTAMSDGADPNELVIQLNEYFEEMVAAVDARGGTVDKFMGDGLMAFFGAPAEQPDHAARALVTAVDMLEKVRSLNYARVNRGLDPIAIGIGIATGTVVVGNVGSTRRLEYTAIGDVVNLAARLESSTKEVGVPLVLDQNAVDAIHDEPLDLAWGPLDDDDLDPETLAAGPAPALFDLGPIRVRGKADAVRVSTVAEYAPDTSGGFGDLDLPAA